VDMVYALMAESEQSGSDECLHAGTKSYFETESRDYLFKLTKKHCKLVTSYVASNKKSVREAIQAFYSRHSDRVLSARAVARVMHGLPSPRDEYQFARDGCWGRYIKFDFHELMRLVTDAMTSFTTR
jgi:hypothetical protein